MPIVNMNQIVERTAAELGRHMLAASEGVPAVDVFADEDGRPALAVYYVPGELIPLINAVIDSVCGNRKNRKQTTLEVVPDADLN